MLYIKGQAINDREIVETIFYWVAVNIYYIDDPYYESGSHDSIAISTLRTKKSGCEGTARLFYELCEAAQIESKVVFGYARGSSSGGRRISNPNHGWNVVKVNNEWKLVDATWGGRWHLESRGHHNQDKDAGYEIPVCRPGGFCH